jgi:hypothetical protein
MKTKTDWFCLVGECIQLTSHISEGILELRTWSIIIFHCCNSPFSNGEAAPSD